MGVRTIGPVSNSTHKILRGLGHLTNPGPLFPQLQDENAGLITEAAVINSRVIQEE